MTAKARDARANSDWPLVRRACASVSDDRSADDDRSACTRTLTGEPAAGIVVVVEALAATSAKKAASAHAGGATDACERSGDAACLGPDGWAVSKASTTGGAVAAVAASGAMDR